MLAEEHRAMLALLDHDERWPHLADQVSGEDQVVLSGEQFGFAVVEHQAVDPAQQFTEIVRLGADQRSIVSATTSDGPWH